MEGDIESVVKKIKTGILSTIKTAANTPICLVFGPNHVGKSTLINRLHDDTLQFVEVPDFAYLTDYALKFITIHRIHSLVASAKQVKVLLVMKFSSINDKDETGLDFLARIANLFESQPFDLGLVVTTSDLKLDRAAIYKALRRAHRKYHIKLLEPLLDETLKRICPFNNDISSEKGINSVREMLEDLDPQHYCRIPFNVLLLSADRPYELKEYFKDRIASMVQDILFGFFNQLIENATTVEDLHSRLVKESAKIEILTDDSNIPDALIDAYLRHLTANLVMDVDKSQHISENFAFYNEMLDFLDGRDYHSKLLSFLNYWLHEHKFLERWLKLANFLKKLNVELNTNRLLRIRDFWVDKEADLDQTNFGIVVTKNTFELLLSQLDNMRGVSCKEMMATQIDDLFLRHLNKFLSTVYSNLLTYSFQDTLYKVKDKKDIVFLIGCKGSGKTNLVKTMIQCKYPAKRRLRTNMPTLYTHENVNYLDVPGVYDTVAEQSSVDSLERLAELLRSAERVKFVFVVESELTYIDKVLSLVIGFIPDFEKYSKAIGLVVNKVMFSKTPTANAKRLAYDYDTRHEDMEERLGELMRRKLTVYQGRRDTARTMRELNLNQKKVKLMASILDGLLSMPKGSGVAKFTYFCLSFDPDTIFEYDLVEQNRDRVSAMIDGLEFAEPAFDDFKVE